MARETLDTTDGEAAAAARCARGTAASGSATSSADEHGEARDVEVLAGQVEDPRRARSSSAGR